MVQSCSSLTCRSYSCCAHVGLPRVTEAWPVEATPARERAIERKIEAPTEDSRAQTATKNPSKFASKSTKNQRDAHLHSDARPDVQLGPRKRYLGSQDAQLAAQDGLHGAQDGALGALGGVPIVSRSVPRTTLDAPRPPRSISGYDFGRLGRHRPRFWHVFWTALATCDAPYRAFRDTYTATMHAPLHQRCTKVSAPSIYTVSYTHLTLPTKA